MVALSCGIEAETFGSLMTLASGRVHQLAELGEVVADPLLGREDLGEGGQHPARRARCRAARPDAGDAVKAWTTGSSDAVASAGASSVWV